MNNDTSGGASTAIEPPKKPRRPRRSRDIFRGYGSGKTTVLFSVEKADVACVRLHLRRWVYPRAEFNRERFIAALVEEGGMSLDKAQSYAKSVEVDDELCIEWNDY